LIIMKKWENFFIIAANKGGYWSQKQLAAIIQWKENSKNIMDDKNSDLTFEECPRKLRVVETVLNHRSNRILIVLERTYDNFNQKAVLRTAECFGIQNVWMVEPVETKNIEKGKRITLGTERFLTLRSFKTTRECIDALRQEDRQIWATDLSPVAVSLEDNNVGVPPKLAVVFGREAEGCSKEILDAADKRVYLPLHGFAESLNLSVAAALVIQRLLRMCPDARGDLSDNQKAILRKEWHQTIGVDDLKKEEYLLRLDDPSEREELNIDELSKESCASPKRIAEKGQNMDDEHIDKKPRKH